MAQDKWNRRKETLARPVRIVEHGSVRTVVEAMFVCEQSTIVRQYVIGHLDGMLQLRDTVFYNHKDHMLKLMVPLGFDARESVSEALYSAVARAPTPIHEERTNQRWVAVCGLSGNKPVHLAVLNNGTGAHSFTGRELALNVMRSPAYASLNLDPNNLVQNQRFHPRQDQGEHQVIFSILPGGKFDETEVSHEAAVFHVPPAYQVYFPQPAKTDLQRRRHLAETVTVDRRGVTVVALKRSENGKELMIRLQETDGRSGKVRLRVKPYGDPIVLNLGRYQLATVAVTRSARKLSWRPVNLIEE
jgi:alpha-mannosidase